MEALARHPAARSVTNRAVGNRIPWESRASVASEPRLVRDVSKSLCVGDLVSAPVRKWFRRS
jgi:hypothetical protein